MHRRYGLMVMITAIIVLSTAYFGFMAFNASGLPLGVRIVTARTGVITPLSGVALPEGLKPGDRLVLAAQPRLTVDRLIFRRQYREEVALRRFASESAFVTQPETLLDLTVDQVHWLVGAPWVGFYEYTPEGYIRIRRRGEHDLPRSLAADDLVLVKLRAHDSEVDLHEAPSGLGRDGYAFPLRARGHLLGVLVVGQRPGEHYPAEERELIAHVAHAVAASLFALRARVTEEQLSTARAEVSASEERAQACKALLDEARAHNAALLELLRARGPTVHS